VTLDPCMYSDVRVRNYSKSAFLLFMFKIAYSPVVG
jgi:hypothetical protein